MLQDNGSQPAKRRKVADDLDTALPYDGLTKPISPPLLRQKASGPAIIQTLSEPSWGFDDVPKQTVTPLRPTNQTVHRSSTEEDGGGEISYMASPIQLTRIQDLAPAKNVDTLSLKDILGDPLIRECWNFNFLFDLDFVM
jgi:tyrosyl-DNA phosphodiesterase-1